MELRQISDEALLQNTSALVARERELVAEILRHLQEIERRRLFSELGYSSLFVYCVQALGFSEDQAQRRIAAMRLMNQLPQIEEKVESGALTLSNLSRAASHFRQEKISTPEEKVRVLESLEHKSAREAERIILAQSKEPQKLVRDQVRPLTEELVEIRFTAPRYLQEKLAKLQALRAHKPGSETLAGLIDQLCELALVEWDPRAQEGEASGSKARGQAAKAQAARRARGQETASDTRDQTASPQPPPATSKVKAPPPGPATSKVRLRHIPAKVRRQIWRRDQGRCQQCGSEHALQLDHKLPFACGGDHSPENLRLLCRNCNQRAAIVRFGPEKMEAHLQQIKYI